MHTQEARGGGVWAFDPGQSPNGRQVLAELVRVALRALDSLTGGVDRLGAAGPALVGTIRGAGAGASFTRLLDALERDIPLTPEFPFEGSERVGGAVWPAPKLSGQSEEHAVAKLLWRNRADDLPMHVHDYSDRFIIVTGGRGFFHVTEQPFDRFDGTCVRTIAARQWDVFAFRRGTVHTFSTTDHAMALLSCQLPYVHFGDARQYRVPPCRWIAREQRLHEHSLTLRMRPLVG